MQEFVTFTREELYELVWQKPVLRIAAEYAISNVGLSKMCARHGIPVPPRGYWARAEEARPPRTPLPPAKDSKPIRIPLTAPEDHHPVVDELSSRAAAEKQSGERIVVAEHLQKPCELVQQARTALKDVDTDELGFLQRPPGCLDLHVTRGQLSRSLRIADALIKAIQKRGWEATNHENHTVVEIDGVVLRLSIAEGTEVEQKPAKPDLNSSYSFHYNRFNTVRKASGRLTVTVREERDCYRPLRRNWNDADGHRVEDRLNDVVVGMLRLVAAVKKEQLRAEQAERERRERERAVEAAREEQARLRKELQREKRRVESLLQQSKRWRASQNLRLFVAHAQEQGKLTELNLAGQELGTWTAWALQQADRLDPFAVSPPSILDEEERIEHMCDHLRLW